MGKRSKSKRKERRKEFRQRKTLDSNTVNLEQVDEEAHGHQYQHRDLAYEYDRPYFVNDRVWFYCDKTSVGADPHTFRGVVRDVARVSSGVLGVISLQSLINKSDVVWYISLDNVFPDFCDMTLRFNVGDHVLCKYKTWVPKLVEYHWPIFEVRDSLKRSFSSIRSPRDLVPHYKCGPASQRCFVASPSDNDAQIRKHPTIFRFSVGDFVSLNHKLAFIPGKSICDDSNGEGTILCEGVVTQVDITGKYDGYFVYECECSFFGAQDKFTCYILHDDDQHIAGTGADPRERLFDAISQDCSPDHFAYLVSTYSIDVSMFRDLVINKAFEHGSYNVSLFNHDVFNS